MIALVALVLLVFVLGATVFVGVMSFLGDDE